MKMTSKEKIFLTKELSRRLFCDTLIEVNSYGTCNYSRITKDGEVYISTLRLGLSSNKPTCLWVDINRYGVRPYLRPLSDIREDEEKEIEKFGFSIFKKTGIFDNSINKNNNDITYIDNESIKEIIEYLDNHHFDYSGLIKRKLALIAKKEMYEKI